MTSHMIELVQFAAWCARMDGPVLEIGSYMEQNQEHLDMRKAFPQGTPYLGIDVLSGPGVDQQVDMLNPDQMTTLLSEYHPKVTLCLYVVEHVWDIKGAARVLANIWKQHPESWLWVGTHQNQPFHGTANYPDYWRITASGMKHLMEEAGANGVHVLVEPDTSNPGDVLAIRQPAAMVWPEEAFQMVLKMTALVGKSHWELYC